MSRFDQINAAEKEEMLLLDGYRHATEGYEEYACKNPNCGRHRVALRKNGKYICARMENISAKNTARIRSQGIMTRRERFDEQLLGSP